MVCRAVLVSLALAVIVVSAEASVHARLSRGRRQAGTTSAEIQSAANHRQTCVNVSQSRHPSACRNLYTGQKKVGYPPTGSECPPEYATYNESLRVFHRDGVDALLRDELCVRSFPIVTAFLCGAYFPTCSTVTMPNAPPFNLLAYPCDDLRCEACDELRKGLRDPAIGEKCPASGDFLTRVPEPLQELRLFDCNRCSRSDTQPAPGQRDSWNRDCYDVCIPLRSVLRPTDETPTGKEIDCEEDSSECPPETTESSDATETSERPDSTETSERTDATETSERPDATETSERPSDATETSERPSDATETSERPDATETSETTSPTEFTDTVTPYPIPRCPGDSSYVYGQTTCRPAPEPEPEPESKCPCALCSEIPEDSTCHDVRGCECTVNVRENLSKRTFTQNYCTMQFAFRVRYHGYVCGSETWSLEFEMLENYFDFDDEQAPAVNSNFTVKIRSARQASRCCFCDDLLDHFDKGREATFVIAGQVTSGVREMRYTGRDSLIVEHDNSRGFANKIRSAVNNRKTGSCP